MAVATWSSSAARVKAVPLLFILVLLAVTAGASSTEDGPTVAISKSGGRFPETPLGRKLLTHNACGVGTAPDHNCKAILPLANNATCCTNKLGSSSCWDVGLLYLDKCGSCTHKCLFGESCCYGVCADLTTDNNNCGVCGNKCLHSTSCKYSMCGY